MKTKYIYLFISITIAILVYLFHFHFINIINIPEWVPYLIIPVLIYCFTAYFSESVSSNPNKIIAGFSIGMLIPIVLSRNTENSIILQKIMAVIVASGIGWLINKKRINVKRYHKQ
ncbi:hypothetical protein Barb4_00632 [Bacteroidales bacterium Barb4]|nr:hypothetical protein Barb4_00632 [Bacteroidales bacterium Barb4]